MLLLADDDYHFDVYQTSEIELLIMCIEKLYQEVNNKLIRAVSIKFKSKIPEAICS